MKLLLEGNAGRVFANVPQKCKEKYDWKLQTQNY